MVTRFAIIYYLLPAINSVLSQNECVCTPYHMCEPGDLDLEPNTGFRLNSDETFCPHYLDVCCDKNSTLNESIAPSSRNKTDVQSKGCGIRNVDGMDFNISAARSDNEAGFGEFPWTVAILHVSNSTYICGGSLIHPQVVLTAAHCIYNRSAIDLIIRAGEWDSRTDKERLPYQERIAERIITHPKYNPRKLTNNFALVILSSTFSLGDHINVICLPSQNVAPVDGTNCISTGWNRDVFNSIQRYSAIMKRVSLPLLEFNDCQTRFRADRLGPKFELDRSFICAGGLDNCQIAGGAPFACPIHVSMETRYQQFGILSWSLGCNRETPTAYAGVAVVRDWIDEQMVASGYGTHSYIPN